MRRSTDASAAAPQNRSLRVDAGKLDHLVNLVGELEVSMAQIGQLAEESGLAESYYNVMKLVSEIRDSSFGLRMVPVGSVFQRFRRSVFDLSKELGKEVELALSGSETELDKNIVEKITDPLLHLVRNAIDHGIESPAERVQAGKAPVGRLRLNAYNKPAIS